MCDIIFTTIFFKHKYFLSTDHRYSPNLACYYPIFNAKHSIYEETIIIRTKPDFYQTMSLIYSCVNTVFAKDSKLQCNVNKNTVANFYYGLSDSPSI